MAEKLVWRDGEIWVGLYLGGWRLAAVWRVAPKTWDAVNFGGPNNLDEVWETKEDAMQDVEREVRRLLREAGVEVKS